MYGIWLATFIWNTPVDSLGKLRWALRPSGSQFRNPVVRSTPKCHVLFSRAQQQDKGEGVLNGIMSTIARRSVSFDQTVDSVDVVNSICDCIWFGQSMIVHYKLKQKITPKVYY